MLSAHLQRLIFPPSSKEILRRLEYIPVCHLLVCMANSLPTTHISYDAVFLLSVIPYLVWWLYDGMWEPASMVVWVLTWFGLCYNRFELHTLLNGMSGNITQSAFVVELTSSLKGMLHSYYYVDYLAELYLHEGNHLQVIILQC